MQESSSGPDQPSVHELGDVSTLENDMELLNALYELDEEHGHPNEGASQ